MIGACLYLALHTIKNRLISQVRRLRRPRYFLFALFGGGYFYLIAGRHWVAGLRMAGEAGQRAFPPAFLELVAALVILIAITASWCGPSPVSPLNFTQAEIQYLLPAPISRASLIRWKLIKAQVGVIFSVLIFTSVSGPYMAAGGLPIYLAGAWVAFATMQLHLTGIRMARHTLQRRNIGWATRAALMLALTAVVVTLSASWAWRSIGPEAPERLRRLSSSADLQRYLGDLLGTGPAGALIYPARLIVRPALAANAGEFTLAMLPALGLLILNYTWVISSGVTLEEGAVEAARRLEERKTAASRGIHGRTLRMRMTKPPFVLLPMGRPETALLWKNLICAMRGASGLHTLSWLLGAGLIPVFIILVARGRLSEIAVIMGVMCAMMALALLVIGPSVMRSDFRQDLLRIDLLRSYPLRGHTLLVGTLLAPVLILTILQWSLLLAFAVLTGASTRGLLPPAIEPPLLALTAAILVLPMNLVAALIHNAAILLVPGWVALGASRTTVVERIGQAMISTIGFIVVVLLSFLPAGLIFGLVYLVASAFIHGGIALPVSALAAASILCAESWMGARLLGAYLDRFDPARELDFQSSP